MKINCLKETNPATDLNFLSQEVRETQCLNSVLSSVYLTETPVKSKNLTNYTYYFYSNASRLFNTLNEFIPQKYSMHSDFTPKLFIDQNKHKQFLESNQHLVPFYYKNQDNGRFLEAVLPPPTESNHSLLASFYSSLNFTLLYAKTYFIGTHPDGTEIYSQFNPNFLSSLDLTQVPLSDTTFDAYSLHSSANRTLFIKNYGHTKQCNNFTSGVFEENVPPVSYTCNTDSQNVGSINNVIRSTYLNIPENADKQNFFVFHIPSWRSKTIKDPVWRNVSLSFLKKRMGIFVPLYAKTQILDKDLNVKNVYILTLNLLVNSFDDSEAFIYRISRYANSAKAFYNFLTKYSFEESIYFTDPELYTNRIKNKYRNFNPYLNLEAISSNSNITSYMEAMQSNLEHFDTFSEDTILSESYLNAVSTAPKENQTLKKRLNKLCLKYLKYLASFQDMKKFASEQKKNIDYALILYRVKVASFNTTSKNSVSDGNFENLLASRSLYKKISNQNNEYMIESIKNNTTEIDPFLSNLSKQNINLLSIKYEDNTSFTSTSNLAEGFSNNTSKKIEEVTFLINKPVAIYVDSKVNPKAVKVGGPYIVRVSRSELYIKLKDKTSFAGVFSDTSSIIIHPHASTVSNSRLSNFSRACLGEASPLLYSAFKQNSLKTIIMAAMTWVTSANSTDVWGRNYKHFLDYSLVNQDAINPREEITEKEVENFLTQAEEALEEETELVVITQEEQTPRAYTSEDFTAPQTAYHPYSNLS